MHKKIPKICTGCKVSEAKIYLYHSTEIAKARPHSEEWQTDTSVQKQWSMIKSPSSSLQYFLMSSVALTKMTVINRNSRIFQLNRRKHRTLSTI